MQRRNRVFVMAALALSTAVLTACGGGGGDPAAATAPAAANPPAGSTPPASTEAAAGALNSAPQIAGTPMTSVLQGTAYVFAPSATDADDNTLTFSIANLPPWATFSSSTGRLSGT